MRIKSFSGNIAAHGLKEHILKDCSVVIDGQNYFYNLYKESGLPFQFGCEADKYAKFLQNHLAMYKKANVKCYIIFKGGHTDKEEFYNKKKQWGDLYEVDGPSEDIILPVFTKAVNREVLGEMDIDYVMCEFEAKTQCIALAQKLKCPIISFDIEFAFSGVPYIPYYPPFNYNTRTSSIHCGIFNLEEFLTKHQLSKEKLAVFIVMTDEKIFPEGFFEFFFERVHILTTKPFSRNQKFLQWLSKNGVDEVLRIVFPDLTAEDKQKFTEQQIKMFNFIGRVEAPGEPMKYLMNGKSISFDNNDSSWFEKGVVTSKIARCYVNLYHWNAIQGSWCIEDNEAEDALFFSVDIIKYAANLLTNYQREAFCFLNNKLLQSINVSLTTSVQKPRYEANNSPFENGWSDIKSLKLFDHFLEEFMPDVSLIYLLELPEDARLFVLTLVYFSRRKTVDTTRESYSILLSYVMLGVVFQNLSDGNNNEHNSIKLKQYQKKYLVNRSDCDKAYSILAPFFNLNRVELMSIFDRKLIHPFVEFQHCLNQMNNLNKLCGNFEDTVYSKAYNGTFVYKFFYSIKNESTDNILGTIKKMLTPAPTVLNIFMRLVKVYEETKKSYL